jgi:hypothetical protein
MLQHGTSHIRHGTNQPLCNPVLVMSIGTAETNLLAVLPNVLNECIGFESTIVCQI